MWACLSEESTGWVFGSVRPLPVRRPWSRAALPEGATSPRSWWCGGAEDVLSGCSPSGDASFSVLPVSSLARACSCDVGQLIGMDTSRIATHLVSRGKPSKWVANTVRDLHIMCGYDSWPGSSGTTSSTMGGPSTAPSSDDGRGRVDGTRMLTLSALSSDNGQGV